MKSDNKYRYGYGSNTTTYSDMIEEHIRIKELERKKQLNQPSLLGGIIMATNKSLMLTPIKIVRGVKSVVKANDGIWKKIKGKIGFKDDHQDKNYRL